MARLRYSGPFGRIFLSFLMLGFLTDVSFWYLNTYGANIEPIYFFNLYALAEGLFFFWLTRSLAPNLALKRVSSFFLWFTPFAWGLILTLPVFETGKTGRIIPFVVFYEVAVSFLAGFGLLALAEKESRLWEHGGFWFLLGVFFYCFCTFFVMTFLGKELMMAMWPLNNIINILTYFLYSLGWWRYGKPGLRSMA